MGATVSVLSKTTDPDNPGLVTAVEIRSTAAVRTTPRLRFVLGAGAAVAFCVLVASMALPHPVFPPTSPPTVVEGLTIFAVFFVGAQALERLLEPLSLALGIGAAEKDAAQQAIQAAAEAAADPLVDATTAVAEAATAKAHHLRCTAEKVVLFWGIASGLAALASGSFGFYFLSSVGIPVPQLWMEILGTALIIGAGTKPLHDLIRLIEKKKDATPAGAL